MTSNATAETVRTSGMWRGTFARHRCLVFADGFYEWLKVDIKSKQPYLFALSDRRPFAFAGLWDAWKDRDGTWLQSFPIISNTPNELTAKVHNRMPVILAPKGHDGSKDVERPPHRSAQTFAADEMTFRSADPQVGNVRNNEPGLCREYRCSPNSA